MNEQIEITQSETAASQAAINQKHSFWSTLREAVAGSEQNFTEGSIGRAIFLLSVPMVLEMAMESLFGIVNIFWVGKLGKDQAAAVGITESLLTIVFTVAMGLSMGTTAMVARRTGEKDPDGAARAAEQSILLGILVSIPIALAGVFFHRQFFALMNAEPAVTEAGSGYATVIFGANVVIMLIFLINAIFRGAGNAAIAMRSLWIGNIINLVLDPILIFGIGPFPELGVKGSAIATTIGRGIAVVYQLSRLSGGHSRVPLHFNRLFKPNLEFMWTLLKISVGGMIQMLIATSAWMVLMSLVGRFGSAAQAGYTFAIRIIVVTILPAWGMSNAAATLVGQNLGAQKPDRAEKSVWLTCHSNAVFMAVVTFVYVFFAEFLIRIFTKDETVIPFGVDALRYIGYGYIFYGYGMVLSASFNGAGDTYTPTVINLICFWVLQLPLAYWLAVQTAFGVNGVFLAITIAESVLAIIAMVIFKQGKWKSQKV
ncbi:MAG: MATE family efflux transporter [Acidobacteriota bacterium]